MEINDDENMSTCSECGESNDGKLVCSKCTSYYINERYFLKVDNVLNVYRNIFSKQNKSTKSFPTFFEERKSKFGIRSPLKERFGLGIFYFFVAIVFVLIVRPDSNPLEISLKQFNINVELLNTFGLALIVFVPFYYLIRNFNWSEYDQELHKWMSDLKGINYDPEEFFTMKSLTPWFKQNDTNLFQRLGELVQKGEVGYSLQRIDIRKEIKTYYPFIYPRSNPIQDFHLVFVYLIFMFSLLQNWSYEQLSVTNGFIPLILHILVTGIAFYCLFKMVNFFYESQKLLVGNFWLLIADILRNHKLITIVGFISTVFSVFIIKTPYYNQIDLIADGTVGIIYNSGLAITFCFFIIEKEFKYNKLRLNMFKECYINFKTAAIQTRESDRNHLEKIKGSKIFPSIPHIVLIDRISIRKVINWIAIESYKYKYNL